MNWRAGVGRASFLRLVPRAFVTCLYYRLRLSLRPVETLDSPAPAVRAGLGASASSRDISRAVYFASRWIPAAHCLPQSLAVRAMMARAGRPCELRFGVSTSAGFRAHAWVTESATEGNQIVHGNTDGEFALLKKAQPV